MSQMVIPSLHKKTDTKKMKATYYVLYCSKENEKKGREDKDKERRESEDYVKKDQENKKKPRHSLLSPPRLSVLIRAVKCNTTNKWKNCRSNIIEIL